MLILTAADADQVRGLTVLGHALAPVPLADGTFALPEACLNDPAHKIRWPILAQCDIMLDSSIRPGVPLYPGDPSSPTAGSDFHQDPDVIAANDYSSSWKVGEPVAVAGSNPKGLKP